MTRSAGRKAVALAVAGAAAGISSVFVGAAPASAFPTPCGPDGTLISGNICEQTFTTPGTATFTPNANMGKLEVLLVGGGATGFDFDTAGTGYGPTGGGGGDVKVVDFTGDHSTALDLNIGGQNQDSTVSKGATTHTADSGEPGVGAGGTSGSGKAGSNVPSAPNGGGGAGASPTSEYNGGAGIVVSSLVGSGSLFNDDADCFGGGGAVGVHGGTIGSASCGGGSVTDGATTTDVVSPEANSGGGGGGGDVDADDSGNTSGAAGLIVVRWQPTVTLTLAANGHGSTRTEKVNWDSAPAVPADPTATGWVFKGWFTDSTLTTPADFSTPLTTSTTFFASWDPALATTGGGFNAAEIPIGIAALSLGLVLAAAGARRRRRTLPEPR